MSLTPEGELLLSHDRRLLKLNEEAVLQFLSPALEGTVRFGSPEDVGTRILPGGWRRSPALIPPCKSM